MCVELGKMSKQYILYEHAAGYALFHVELEEHLTNFSNTVSNISNFKRICHFTAFQPFKRGREALDNLNSISESILHIDLEIFLNHNLPKKKDKYVLGVEDTNLISCIKEKLGIICNCTDAVKEFIRGVRLHFHALVPGFCDLKDATKVQLGLAHAYSRAKVKFNVGRVDNMIIQTISLVDQLDKDINALTMRIREWYSHHFPELIKLVPENVLFIQCVRVIKNRKNMPEDVAEKLENILNDPEKVQSIIELARSSMGMDIANDDLKNMYYFAKRVMSLSQRRKDLTDYLKSKMLCVAPNLAALIGEFVAARLIAQAGSLVNLAKAPASTVQILGAEKALFRALKTRGNTPKYGLLYHSSFIGRAAKRNKGRISRYLANKCSVASRIDCFRELPTDAFGNKMKEQVEERLKLYEKYEESKQIPTDQTPKKNNDVMEEAMQEAVVSQNAILKHIKCINITKSVQKKVKKRKLEEIYLPTELDQTMETLSEDSVANEAETSIVKKKKKKRKLDNTEQESSISTDLDQSMVQSTNGIAEGEVDTSVTKKKKKESKKHLNDTAQELSISTDLDSTGTLAESSVAGEVASATKKKSKRKLNDTAQELSMLTELDMSALAESSLPDEGNTSGVKKKKKKSKKHLNDTAQELSFSTDLDCTGTLAESSVAGEVTSATKKKSKRKLNDTAQELSVSTELDMSALAESSVPDEGNTNVVKKKKKKRKSNTEGELSLTTELDQNMSKLSNDIVVDEVDTSVSKKKSKKKTVKDNEN